MLVEHLSLEIGSVSMVLHAFARTARTASIAADGGSTFSFPMHSHVELIHSGWAASNVARSEPKRSPKLATVGSRLTDVVASSRRAA